MSTSTQHNSIANTTNLNQDNNMNTTTDATIDNTTPKTSKRRFMCPECVGSKVNSIGLPCGKCGATGFVTVDGTRMDNKPVRKMPKATAPYKVNIIEGHSHKLVVWTNNEGETVQSRVCDCWAKKTDGSTVGSVFGILKNINPIDPNIYVYTYKTFKAGEKHSKMIPHVREISNKTLIHRKGAKIVDTDPETGETEIVGIYSDNVYITEKKNVERSLKVWMTMKSLFDGDVPDKILSGLGYVKESKWRVTIVHFASDDTDKQEMVLDNKDLAKLKRSVVGVTNGLKNKGRLVSKLGQDAYSEVPYWTFVGVEEEL